MSKQFSKTINYLGTVDQVLEMFRTPEFLDLLAKDAVSSKKKIDVTGRGVTVYLEIETDEIPGPLKRFFGKTLTLVDTQELPFESTLDEEAKGTRTIKVSEKRASASANVLFDLTLAGCAVTYDGELTIELPVGSGVAESLARKFILAGLNELEIIGNEWLSEVNHM
jgi:hypothetical protein